MNKAKKTKKENKKKANEIGDGDDDDNGDVVYTDVMGTKSAREYAVCINVDRLLKMNYSIDPHNENPLPQCSKYKIIFFKSKVSIMQTLNVFVSVL